MENFKDYQLRLITALESVDTVVVDELITQVLRLSSFNKKILICGNGGSASTSEHFAVDIGTGSLIRKKGIQVIALTSNTAVMTALSNDESFQKVFARQVELNGIEGDMLLCISASGNSENLIEAIKVAKRKSILTVAFLGFDGGKILKEVDLAVHVKSELGDYGIVEDAHLSISHFVTEQVRLRI